MQLRLALPVFLATVVGLAPQTAPAQAPPKGDLSVEVLASTGATYQTIDNLVSINDSGWAAFSALDPSGVSGVFVWRPGFLTDLRVTPVIAGHQYQGVAINSAANPRVATRLREIGPVFKARRYDVLSVGTTAVGQSPTHFDSCQSFVALSDVNIMAFAAIKSGRNQLRAGLSAPPTLLAELAGGSSVRPQISNTDRVVYKDFNGSSIKVVTHPSGPSWTVASLGTGFASFGREPGISPDGMAVAFAANVGTANAGVHVAVEVGGVWSQFKVAGLTGDGFFAVDDQRVGISSSGDPISPDGQRITLVFGAQRVEGRGVHALRVRIKSESGVLTVKGIERYVVAHVGQVVGTRKLDDFRVWDPLTDAGWIAFHGTLEGGVQVVLRSYLVPCKDADGNGSADDDDDSLCDNWETSGIDWNGDGTVDLALQSPTFGADPDIKDLFVEVDWMEEAGGHSHRPPDGALEAVSDSFAVAPVRYPDGSVGGGIRLHAMLDEPVPHAPTTFMESREATNSGDFLDTKVGGNLAGSPGQPCGTGDSDGHFGMVSERASANCEAILGARRLVFRYALFAHKVLNFGSGGLGSPLGQAERSGNDLIVGLGEQTEAFFAANRGASCLPGETPADCGYREVHAGTFMHEVGHTLGLGHGGSDDINCKPNHQSLMNYAVNFTSTTPHRRLDFSRKKLDPLNEASLSESAGTGTSETYGVPYGVEKTRRNRPCVAGVDCTARLARPGALNIDWNNDRFVGGVATDIDINRMGSNCPGDGTVLQGSDDWALVKLNFRESEGFDNLIFGDPSDDSDDEVGMTEDAILDVAATSDADEDGVSNLDDNCPGLSNPLQADADGDGFGDDCDPGGGTPDGTPPVITPDVVPPANANGWHASDVTVTWSVSDPESGIASSTGCTITSVVDETAGLALSCVAVNGAGLTTTQTVIIRLDRTAPDVTGTASPPRNAFGWNNTDVTVAFTCSDGLSGIESCGPALQVVTTEGAGQSRVATATDLAGNTATGSVDDINIDKTPPIITGARAPLPNAAGWNNTDVTVTFTCSDALSGISACGPTPQVVSTEGAGQSRMGEAVDLADNVASVTVGDINIDKTPPVLACGAAPSVLWPPNHVLVDVRLMVEVTDALSGPAGFVLLGAAQDEPDEGLGDGSFPGDIQGAEVGTPDAAVLLRAERSGRGDGRTYMLDHEGRDRADNAATCRTEVFVPHSRR